MAMTAKDKRMAAMKRRFNKTQPSTIISYPSQRIKNDIFGNKKGTIDDDATKTDKSAGKYRKNPPKASVAKKDKKVVKKTSSGGGGQGQSEGNIYLRTGPKTSTTYLGGKGDARTVKSYKFDKDGVKPVKKDKKIASTVKKDNTTTKSKVKATAANTKNFASTMAMQKKLIAKGAKIKADGIMGPKTRAAMAKYMKAPVPKSRPTKPNVSSNKNKKAGIDSALGDNSKTKKKPVSSNSKLDSKGNYKGTNIKPTKLQLDRMRKKMMGAT